MKTLKYFSGTMAIAVFLAIGSLSFVACSAKASTAKTPNEASVPEASVPGQVIDLTYAAEKATPSVVQITMTINAKSETIEYEDPFGDFFSDPFGFFGQGRGNNNKQKRQVQTPKRQGSGSGVIISQDGYIVTNAHVAKDADELNVKLTDDREFSARIIGVDENTDLALIKVSAKNLPAINIGNSENLKVGEWVLAIGNPLNLGTTVTAGIISAKARSLGANNVESFIQTDAAINQGNSGGALVNATGELVGINAMLVSPTASNIGYGFAIPTTIMNKVVSDLKKYGTVQRALLGIQGSDARAYIDRQKNDGKEIDLGTDNGIYVAKVEDASGAGDAGIKEGDVITQIDGRKVTKMSELQEYLARKKPGDKVTLKYLRDKKTATAVVTLKNTKGSTNIVKNADLDVLGASFRPITDEQKEELKISYGLEVLSVSNGRLKDAGMTKGFIIQQVNGESMKSIDDLQDAVKEASTSKDQVLYIKGLYPSGKKGYFAVPLEEE